MCINNEYHTKRKHSTAPPGILITYKLYKVNLHIKHNLPILKYFVMMTFFEVNCNLETRTNITNLKQIIISNSIIHIKYLRQLK